VKVLRVLLGAMLLVCLWPEAPRYLAQWRLADASVRLERILSGQVTGADAVASAQRAALQANAARSGLPWDASVALLEGTALLLLQQGVAAQQVFVQAIAIGERPELTLNLGRALALLGDETGAQQAFLRAAWAAPQSLSTMPRATREALLRQVDAWERQLRAGELHVLPGQ
jgi:hypothetical protein